MAQDSANPLPRWAGWGLTTLVLCGVVATVFTAVDREASPPSIPSDPGRIAQPATTQLSLPDQGSGNSIVRSDAASSPGLALMGRVLSDSGLQPTGSRLRFASESTAELEYVPQPDGGFFISMPRPAPWRLTVSANRHLAKSLTATGPGDLGNIVLAELGTWVIRVVDSGAVGIPSASVLVDRVDLPVCTTDEWGECQVEAPRFAISSVTARARGFVTSTVPLSGEGIVTITLDHAPRIQGRVLTTDHTPIVDAEVQIGEVSTKSDAEGWYEIRSALAGRTAVRAQALGFEAFEGLIDTTADRPFDIVLSRGSTLVWQSDTAFRDARWRAELQPGLLTAWVKATQERGLLVCSGLPPRRRVTLEVADENGVAQLCTTAPIEGERRTCGRLSAPERTKLRLLLRAIGAQTDVRIICRPSPQDVAGVLQPIESSTSLTCWLPGSEAVLSVPSGFDLSVLVIGSAGGVWRWSGITRSESRLDVQFSEGVLLGGTVTLPPQVFHERLQVLLSSLDTGQVYRAPVTAGRTWQIIVPGGSYDCFLRGLAPGCVMPTGPFRSGVLAGVVSQVEVELDAITEQTAVVDVPNEKLDVLRGLTFHVDTVDGKQLRMPIAANQTVIVPIELSRIARAYVAADTILMLREPWLAECVWPAPAVGRTRVTWR